MYPYGSCTVYTICLTYDNRISQCTSALLPDTQAICTNNSWISQYNFNSYLHYNNWEQGLDISKTGKIYHMWRKKYIITVFLVMWCKLYQYLGGHQKCVFSGQCNYNSMKIGNDNNGIVRFN